MLKKDGSHLGQANQFMQDVGWGKDSYYENLSLVPLLFLLWLDEAHENDAPGQQCLLVEALCIGAFLLFYLFKPWKLFETDAAIWDHTQYLKVSMIFTTSSWDLPSVSTTAIRFLTLLARGEEGKTWCTAKLMALPVCKTKIQFYCQYLSLWCCCAATCGEKTLAFLDTAKCSL